MGNKETPIENILISDINLELPGNCKRVSRTVPEGADFYPQPNRWKRLPAFGFFVRYAKGIVFKNISLNNKKPDCREPFVLENTREAPMGQAHWGR